MKGERVLFSLDPELSNKVSFVHVLKLCLRETRRTGIEFVVKWASRESLKQIDSFIWCSQMFAGSLGILLLESFLSRLAGVTWSALIWWFFMQIISSVRSSSGASRDGRTILSLTFCCFVFNLDAHRLSDLCVWSLSVLFGECRFLDLKSFPVSHWSFREMRTWAAECKSSVWWRCFLSDRWWSVSFLEFSQVKCCGRDSWVERHACWVCVSDLHGSLSYSCLTSDLCIWNLTN